VLKEEEHKRKKSQGGPRGEGERGSLVLVGDEERNAEALGRLKAMGFSAILVSPNRFAGQGQRPPTGDLFLIDEALLGGSDWKVLNRIDRTAPQKPMVLLVDESQARDPKVYKEHRVATLEREKLASDPDGATAFIRHTLRRRT